MWEPRRLFRPPPPARIRTHGRCRENPTSHGPTKPGDRLVQPTFLNPKRWVFVKKGLDDFRQGCPPCGSVITRGLPELSAPQRYNRAPRPPSTKRPSCLPKGAAMCSRLSAAQQARKKFLEDVEAQLTPHPLARYPDLKESMPPELLKKVLQVLDPDRKLADAWVHCEGAEEKPKEPTKLSEKRSTPDCPGLSKKTPLSNDPCQSLYGENSHQPLYRENPRQLLSEEKKPCPSPYKERDLLQEDSSYKKARKTVREFCDWATSIGCAEIDEEYIMRQFEVNYEKEASHDEQHTMKLDEVPRELLKGKRLKKQWESEFFQELEPEPEKSSKPKNVKMRYGAWYLHPKLWKRQRAGEPLLEPKVFHKDEKLTKEQKRQEAEFAKLYGPAAFKEFILKKGYRMPSFLENIKIKKKYNCDCNMTPGK